MQQAVEGIIFNHAKSVKRDGRFMDTAYIIKSIPAGGPGLLGRINPLLILILVNR
jgi:hypothetical protein